MKPNALREQSVEQLENSLEDSKKTIYQLKCEFRMTKKLEKPHLISFNRKNIARIKTILMEKRKEQPNG